MGLCNFYSETKATDRLCYRAADLRLHLNLVVRKLVSGFPIRSHINQAARLHKMARGLKFRI